jgi:hypothetical protein
MTPLGQLKRPFADAQRDGIWRDRGNATQHQTRDIDLQRPLLTAP